jgi:subtilisin family serine protease
MRQMRWVAAAGLAVIIGGVVHTASSGRVGSARGTSGQPALRLSVGYASPRALAAALRTTPAVVLRKLTALHVAEVRTSVPAAAARLRRAPGIRFVQRTAARASAAEPGLTLASVTPRAAWEWQYHTTHGDAVPPAVLRAASTVTIAVIDTGADLSAPDIAAKSPVTFNTRTGTGDVRDSNGHGTFVASLAAGSITNDDGIAGAGGDVQLLVVKSGSASGAFTDVDEAAGIVYAVDHGAKIVNLSVGGPTTSATERRAIQYAALHGVLLVAAVGNEYGLGNPAEYPAALLQPHASDGTGGQGLAVTASTSTGVRASFANTGSWVSLAAPGENVFGAVSQYASPATYPRSALPGAQAGLYGYASGTSFAAPQVAGAAALVWAANPSLTAQQVAEILEQTASGHGGWTPELGFGVVDVAAAVAQASVGAPAVLLAGKRVDTKLRLNWTGSAQRYSLSVSLDAGVMKTVLEATPQTTTTMTLARGHSYAFAVAALDDAGVQTAVSEPLTVLVRAARSRR